MFSRLRNSSVGMKYFVGFSGLIWAGFVMTHMAGNLLIFVSPEAYNSYGHALVTGNIIYVVEALLIATLLMHVFLGVRLTIRNRKARGTSYAASQRSDKNASLISKTMIFQGSLILVFVILHLITFKFGEVYMTTVNGVQMRDLYKLMVEVFAQPIYVIWYLVALVILGFHLRHGVSSMFQSFGLLHPAYQKPIKILGLVYAFVVAAGFIAQPVYLYFFM